ncbi:MAG: dihydroorotate dehydrogenase, partial [Muribaculaceae bacterium]|nr:dihydroorotate dehydrogenase [Muribaculaceae bacterium]
VWQVHKAVKIPVIGLGGIMSGRDALEFILAGATAIEVGTANFINPKTTVEIIDYIDDYCQRHGVSDINQLIGII